MIGFNDVERRWLRFKRYGEERVLRIHELERKASRTDGLESIQLAMGFDAELGAYWHKKKTESDKGRELGAFLNHARKIAMDAYNAALAAGKPGGAALHAADLAVVRDAYKINFGPGSPVASSPVLSQVYGGQDRAAGEDAPE